MNYNFKDTLGDLFETFLCDKLIAEKSQVNAS